MFTNTIISEFFSYLPGIGLGPDRSEILNFYDFSEFMENRIPFAIDNHKQQSVVLRVNIYPQTSVSLPLPWLSLCMLSATASFGLLGKVDVDIGWS